MNKYLTLVNKENEIKQNYLKNIKLLPLKDIDNKETFLEEEAAKAYKKLHAFFKKKGIDLGLDSCYRTIEYQQELKNQFIRQYGEEYANKVVAPPKTSEHHTGLAIDLSMKIDGKYDRVNRLSRGQTQRSHYDFREVAGAAKNILKKTKKVLDRIWKKW